jgi:hypothetical protein
LFENGEWWNAITCRAALKSSLVFTPNPISEIEVFFEHCKFEKIHSLGM